MESGRFRRSLACLSLALPNSSDPYLMGANVRRAALTAALAVSAGLLAACGGSGPPANLISVSNGSCGGSWHVAGPGWYTFQIYDAAAGRR